ncbi:hypothetical protein [Alterinioella nitratireducens]|uniref:hypothetical protein n=1 Tax=Alterinioella nitratireducens TaxID=2735915 RepID=UPI001551F495|nr:hypothetical protein [Alterinioella nitratireducens]NPD21094.1 hypothetical protein [Alterinioella nitratireducens]
MSHRPAPYVTPPPWRRALPRLALRVAVLAAIVTLAHFGINAALDWTHTLPEADRGAAEMWVLISIFGLYALLIAIPFVPGIEIAMALLMLRGAELALPIYLSTVGGLMLAYLVGRLVPPGALRRIFLDLHLTRACALIDDLAPLSPPDRVAVLQDRLPQRVAALLLRYRYVCLALLINLPGSGLIGGGGGICMVAGMSRIFSPRWTALTLALAVLPVPLATWMAGAADLLFWLPE